MWGLLKYRMYLGKRKHVCEYMYAEPSTLRGGGVLAAVSLGRRTQFSQAGWPATEPWRYTQLHHSSAWVHGHGPPLLAFQESVGILTHVFMLLWQALYRLIRIASFPSGSTPLNTTTAPLTAAFTQPASTSCVSLLSLLPEAHRTFFLEGTLRA